MKILLQRVASAQVTVGDRRIAQIDAGLLLFIGFGQCDQGDVDKKIDQACGKLVNLRVFCNERGKLDYSVSDIKADILAVPQFTLYGKSVKGRRPDFTDALTPALAEQYFHRFANRLSGALDRQVYTGQFGADMMVSLVNDGPLTLQFDY